MTSLLVKFGYIGWLYTGFQKGNGSSSIEDTILKVLIDEGISDKLNSAARTDRGVSALGNVIKIETEEKPEKILGILNHEIRGMLFHSWAEAEDGMNARHCDSKTYRYILPRNMILEKEENFERIMRKFVGTHDFINFCRKDARNTVRTVNSIKFHKERGFLTIDITGKSFLWNQIRIMIAYALKNSPSDGNIDPFELDSRFPAISIPDSLILLDVFYKDKKFKKCLNRSKIETFKDMINKSSMQARIFEQFNSILKQIK